MEEISEILSSEKSQSKGASETDTHEEVQAFWCVSVFRRFDSKHVKPRLMHYFFYGTHLCSLQAARDTAVLVYHPSSLAPQS